MLLFLTCLTNVILGNNYESSTQYEVTTSTSRPTDPSTNPTTTGEIKRKSLFQYTPFQFFIMIILGNRREKSPLKTIVYRVAQKKTEQSIQSIFQVFALINYYFFHLAG